MAELAILAAVSIGTSIATSLLTPKTELPPVDAGRHDDIRIMGSEYGTTVPIIYGRVRLAGNIIWSDGVQPIVSTTLGRSGGKGLGGSRTPEPPQNVYSYYTNLAIAISEGEIKGGLRRMWENANVTVNLDIHPDPLNYGTPYEAESGDNLLTNGAIVVFDPAASGNYRVQLANSNSSLKFTNITSLVTETWDAIVHYSAEADFSCMVKVNNEVAVEYYFDSTGSFNTYGSITIPVNLVTGSNTIEFFRNSAFPAPQIDLIRLYDPNIVIPPYTYPNGVTGIIDDIAIPDSNDPRPIFNYRVLLEDGDTYGGSIGTGGSSGNLGNFRFYTGSETQEQDPLLVSIDGAEQTPAYRGICYVVLVNYNILDGRLPNFSFEIEEGTHSLAEILIDLYSKVGLPSQYLDFSGIAGVNVYGLVITHRTELSQVLDALQIAYNFDLVEADGKIKAVLRGADSVVTIDHSKLRAYEAGGQTPDADLESDYIDESQLPEEIDLSYIDKNLDYHQNVQPARRQFGSTADPQTITLPLVMSATQAQQIALRILYTLHLQQNQHQFSLGPEYLYLLPTDVINLTFPNKTYNLRLIQMQAGLMGLIKMQSVPELATLYNQITEGTSGDGTTLSKVPFPANTKLILMDVPPINNLDSGIGYYAVGAARSEGNWTGAVLYKEDETGAFARVGSFQAQGTIGVVTTGKLSASPTYDVDGFDITSDLYISLYNGTLESFTEVEILNSRLNMAYIDGELVQFVNAVSEAPTSPYVTKYHVTKFLRGCLGTESKITTHDFSEDFVLFTSAVQFIRDTSRSNFIGSNFKAVTLGQPIDTAELVTFASGNNNAPPVASWDSSIVSAGSTPTLHDAGIIIDSNYGINNTFNPYILGYVKFGAYASAQRARIYWTAPSSSEVLTDIILRPDSANKASFRFTAPQNGVHTFRLVTEDEFGQVNTSLSHPSASVTVASITQSIDVPINLSTSVGMTSVTFTWDSPLNNLERITGYEIWKSTDTGVTSNRLATVSGRSWTETISNFTLNSLTRYIRAIDNMGNNSAFVQFSFPAALDSILKVFDNVVPKDSLSGLGLTIGVARTSGSGSWFGSNIYRDRGYGYELIGTLEEDALIGKSDTGHSFLPSIGGTLWMIKEGGSDPTNATSDEIINGKNNYFVGREKIGVQTWTDMGSDLWKGETLSRGLNNTNIFQLTHTGQEDIIQLDENAVFIPIEFRDVGQILDFKAVTFGQNIADVDPVSFTIRGDSVRPIAPSDDVEVQDASGDLLVQCVIHPRFNELPANAVTEVWTSIDRSNPVNLKRTLPMPIGGSHAVPLIATSYGDDGAVQNNLYCPADTVASSAVSIESLTATYTKFEFNIRWIGINGGCLIPISFTKFIFASFLGALARTPTGGEETAWRNSLQAAYDIDQAALLVEARSLLDDLFTSAEYIARVRTDAEFVSDVYRAYLDRASEALGLAYHLNRLVLGETRDNIRDDAVGSTGFAYSPEFLLRVSTLSPSEVPIRSAIVALQTRANTDPVSGKYTPDLSVSPISIEWQEGTQPFTIREIVRSYGVIIAEGKALGADVNRDIDPGFCPTDSPTSSGRPGPRYKIELSGTEYRIYSNGVKLAVVSNPSSGFPYPLRLAMEIRDEPSGKMAIEDIIASSGFSTTIYSVANQIADFGAGAGPNGSQTTYYLRLYQTSLLPGIQGFPLDVTVNT